LSALALASTPAAAQLVSWDVSGITADAINPFAGSVGTHIAGGSLFLGEGLTASSTADTFGGSSLNQSTFSGAITDGDYLAFTFTPTAGYIASISSISLNLGGSDKVDFHVALLSSATGFTSSDALWSYDFTGTSPAPATITLTNTAALQSLSSATTFRLYGWRDTPGTATFRIRNRSGNDLTIAGTTSPVPEPATYAALLGGLVLLGTVLQRRHRARRPAPVTTAG
jgi:hypothetical protein